jgi:predicted ribosome quality control (RQC) complex YloA/Tae2 family protein
MGGTKSGPLRVVTKDGYVIWVGRNSRQNELVTFDKGSPQDWWLHARGVPGAHVIVKSADGRPLPDGVAEQAAALAAYYSANRGSSRVEVDVTQRRHVRKIKGGATGMVTYRNETTRAVAPRSEREFNS